jgi:hypothetical protein
MLEKFLNGFQSFSSAIFYRTNSYWCENMAYFWDEINSGWMEQYIWPYDDFNTIILSEERKLRLAQEVPKIYLSVEDYDKLVEKINNPDPEQIESLRRLLTRRAPWDE